jgi:hypothetical protein
LENPEWIHGLVISYQLGFKCWLKFKIFEILTVDLHAKYGFEKKEEFEP